MKVVMVIVDVAGCMCIILLLCGEKGGRADDVMTRVMVAFA